MVVDIKFNVANDICLVNKHERKPKKQSKIDNPEILATLSTRHNTKTKQIKKTENRKILKKKRNIDPHIKTSYKINLTMYVYSI